MLWGYCKASFFNDGRERERELLKPNTQHYCVYFNQKELCEIHSDRPVDCRIFPFDVLKIGGKFYWTVWKLKCSILENEETFEPFLQEHEREIIPKFVEHINDYSQFRLEELLSKYQFKVLREVKIESSDKFKNYFLPSKSR